ncbi:MAG: hydrogenase maturation protease [Terracidiphilus sp.]|nr:hydrogenase maturation protease [Terracidiphilus sp.]
MTQPTAQCLILACGNTLRSDDGIGPWLAAWAEDKFRDDPNVRVLARQQWTPDLAEEIAQAETVLFIDCSVESAPGSVRIAEVEACAPAEGLATHHQGAPELLALASELYNSVPRKAQLLTIGAGSIELGEEFSEAVLDAIPQACALLERAVLESLREP